VATVRKGTKSSAQDNFIGPNNVSGVSSTNVGSGRAYNDGRLMFLGLIQALEILQQDIKFMMVPH